MSKSVNSPVYFDNAATQPLLPEALAKLNELNASVYGNSSSVHQKGRQAQEILSEAQESLARYFQVPPTHVIFTSGGTESTNLGIWGSLGGIVQAFQWLKSGTGGKVITSTIEHDATKKVFESLQQMGAQVGWVDVDQQGFLNLAKLESELSTRTRLVSFHHVQNEIGVVQDLRAVSHLVRAKQPDALIHVDAVQSFMKIPVHFEELGIDLVSLSAHKIGGPKGVGALVLGRRFETRNPKVGAFLCGSSQQYGMRPGTVPVPMIGSFIAAFEASEKTREAHREKLLDLRDALLSKLPTKAVLNGPTDTSRASARRAPQTVNFSIPGLPSAVAVEALSERGYCISAGSACHSTSPKPNETITKMGLGRERALSAVRVSFNTNNTLEEVNGFLGQLEEVIQLFA